MADEQKTDTEHENWVREQFQKASKHLASKGILPDKVIVAESRYLQPWVALWKLTSKGPKTATYWVISGDLPVDHAEVGAAPNPREAIRHFALSWQLKAENLLQQAGNDNDKRSFAQLLIGRAEGLYKLYDNEPLWVNEPKNESKP